MTPLHNVVSSTLLGLKVLVLFIVLDTCTAASVMAFPAYAVKRDTLEAGLDRHPLVSIGYGYSNDFKLFDRKSKVLAMIELEYPLDRNRNWNIDIVYFRIFNYSRGESQDGGLISFRRYLIAQENDIRPSVHIGLGGLSLDIGGAIDVTLVRRLLYTQVCYRVPVQFLYTHDSSSEMPTMLTLSMRLML